VKIAIGSDHAGFELKGNDYSSAGGLILKSSFGKIISMRIAKERRRYIAGSLAKVFEFVTSVLVIGYLVAAKLDPRVSLDLTFIIGSVIFALGIIIAGVLVTPVDERREEEG